MHHPEVRARSETAPSFLPPGRTAAACTTSRDRAAIEPVADPAGKPFSPVGQVQGGSEWQSCPGEEPAADETERRLLALISAGSRTALAQLHFRYFPQLTKFFGRLLATPAVEVIEDLIAETMFRVCRDSAKLPGQTSVQVWILRTAYACGTERLSIERPRNRLSMRSLFRSRHRDNQLCSRLASPPHLLHEALGRLPVTDRALVHLVYSGHSRLEVADILSLPCESVDRRLASARVTLDSSLAWSTRNVTGRAPLSRAAPVAEPGATLPYPAAP